VKVTRVQVGPLETNCWVVSDDVGGPVVVIDPGGDAALIRGAIGSRPVAAIVLTHAHFDHLGAVSELVDATKAPLLVQTDDAQRLTSSEAGGTGGALFGFDQVAPEADRVLVDGDVVEAGELVMRVLHTPGHTGGGICLAVEDPSGGEPHLFSGDTLFAGSVGRTDFPGGDARALSRSIAEKLAPLPPTTLVHPGHGPDTTIGREARINPFWPRA
jgi:glyoxylase-like metal-dependent hydrolase (beta-lactamase superfamily II)